MMPVPDSREKDRLRKISEVHSYGEGFNGRLAKYRALQVRQLYAGGGSLLDLGAGEGLLATLLADHFTEMEIVEASSLYLERAKSLLSGRRAVFQNALIEDFDTNRRFDVVLLAGVLEHVQDPRCVLGKAKKFMKVDGTLIVIVPNATSFHRRIGVEMGLMEDCYVLGEQDFRVGHRRYYDLPRLRQEMYHAGLRVVQSGGILFKVLPNDQMANLGEDYCDALYQIGKKYPELCAEIYAGCRK
jgi:SAM-dependent methyltransferase